MNEKVRELILGSIALLFSSLSRHTNTHISLLVFGMSADINRKKTIVWDAVNGDVVFHRKQLTVNGNYTPHRLFKSN
jgi:hypothetical protein